MVKGHKVLFGKSVYLTVLSSVISGGFSISL